MSLDERVYFERRIMDKVLYLLGLYNSVEGNDRNGRKMKEIWQWEREAGNVIFLVSVNTKQVDKVQHKCINTLSVFHKMELLNYVRGTYHLSTRFNLILGSLKEILDHNNQGLISKNRFWLIVRKLYKIWQTPSFWNRTRFWYKTGNMFDIQFNSRNSEGKWVVHSL